ncbi:hypothetical protein FACS1894152_8600 [Bacilli bacterium]|nr:hypothetical protein FACS1894152_8600 [Bacilli bacterium]
MIEEDKMKEKDIAKILHIHPTTIARWHARYKKTKNPEDKKYKTNYKTGRPARITDMDKFREFIDKNSDLSLREMAYKLNGERDDMNIY